MSVHVVGDEAGGMPRGFADMQVSHCTDLRENGCAIVCHSDITIGGNENLVESSGSLYNRRG